MQLRFLIPLSLAVSCGDNNVPQPDMPPADAPLPPDAMERTWGDAETVWARAWCGYAQRCYPDEFAYYFENIEKCTVDLQAQNCAVTYRLHDCSEQYPADREELLLQCEADMNVIECSAVEAPASCYEAFGQ